MNVVEFVRMTTATITGEDPRIEESEDAHGLVIKIVPTGDVACLIGSKGKNIKALQALAIAIGYKGKHRIHVYIEEDR